MVGRTHSPLCTTHVVVLMLNKIQFFTWDTLHPNMSWWAHFEREVPNLADLGVTQVWLPPPNKATHQVELSLVDPSVP